MLAVPTYDELFSQFHEEMQKIGFTYWSEGSIIAAIGRVQAAYQSDLWNQIAEIALQLDPSTATGTYLDRLGRMFGVTRKPSQYASTVGKGNAVKFTNNGATTTVVPAGTRVWSSGLPGVGFFTQETLSLDPGEEGYANIVAAVVGEVANMGVGALNSHNAGMTSVSVTNILPVGGGTGMESDESYRYRITRHLQTRGGATETAIQQAILQVPGVRDVLTIPGARGGGSVDILVVPIDRYASNDLLASAEDAARDTVAAGIAWRILTPKTRRVDVQVQLRLAAGANTAAIHAQTAAAIRGYIDNLQVDSGKGGSDLYYNELVSRVMDASNQILDSSINLRVDGEPVLQTNITTHTGERLVSGNVSIV